MELRPPLVHGAWTAAWWEGVERYVELFGPAPSERSLTQVAQALTPREPSDWTVALNAGAAAPPPEDALVVLAGQQPVVAGGALLVAHKAATAVALARHLSASWDRPVVPVFLLADEDHDTDEIDHLDLVDPSGRNLVRRRVPLQPRHEAFFRCTWDREALHALLRDLGPLRGDDKVILKEDDAASSHVAKLLDATFGPLGLLTVDAHRLKPWGQPLLERALADPGPLARSLARGAAGLDQVGRAPSFDADDPRPLVLESRDGRRRRLEAGDAGATARLAARPDDFSPHAALRPQVQARALPVVAQVCGPSEILYLGQARGLHELFGLTPPVLVPRLEATRLKPGDGPDDLQGAPQHGVLEQARQTFTEAAEAFVRQVRQADPGLERQTRRWLDHAQQGARRLAAAPSFRGRAGRAFLRPRGRYQDMVLAWAPEAWSRNDPAGWGRHIVELCRPLEPPAHVLHTYPVASPDGNPDASPDTSHG